MINRALKSVIGMDRMTTTRPSWIFKNKTMLMTKSKVKMALTICKKDCCKAFETVSTSLVKRPSKSRTDAGQNKKRNVIDFMRQIISHIPEQSFEQHWS